MKKILVTGAKGQLGKCLNLISIDYPTLEFSFKDSNSLDITNAAKVENELAQEAYDYCINCAAYTAVDNAEENIKLAREVNTIGAKNLAQACLKFKTTLVHISTDFVFNGESNKPYQENDKAAPISVYGRTKLNGELEISSILPQHFIIRTSWLYSEFENNFVKTMLKLSATRNVLTIISDQVGSPTYAKDLAKVVLSIILSNKTDYGVYHYSNEGVASWYDFTKAIFEIKNINTKVQPIPSTSYPTPANRPYYSILNKEKIKNTFSINIPYWKTSLKNCLKQL